jgi:uncharacterized damage-inducible protein DinB
VKIIDFFVAQLDRESAITRRTLEKVPEGKPDWKPHAKSMPMGYLTNLVATMPAWIELAIKQDELDLNPPSGKKYQTPDTPTTKALVEAHDASVAKARAALQGTSEEHLLTRWKLLVGGQVVQESPRFEVVADTFTHLAHHRAQLGVYLRLNETAVPSVYGPSADDRSF